MAKLDEFMVYFGCDIVVKTILGLNFIFIEIVIFGGGEGSQTRTLI